MATTDTTSNPSALPLKDRQPSVRPSLWTRWLTPSIADIFFIALIAWLFLGGGNGWTGLLHDGDVGWHIRAGEYMFAHHSVPTHDLFSFSKPDARWFAWEWLSDVLDWGLYRLGGLKGVVLFAGVLIGAYAIVLLRFALWSGANPLVATAATILAVDASSMHFQARPHLFTLLFLPLSLWLIESDRRKRNIRVWALVPLSTLWANLHGGFAILLACILVTAIGASIENWKSSNRWKETARYSILFGMCAAASVVNPFGIDLHRHILDYLRSDWIRSRIEEFQAPTFRSDGQLQYEFLLLAGLILAGFLLRKGRTVDALWIIFLGHSSLMSVRHAPLYASIAAPLIAAELSIGWGKWVSRLKNSSMLRILYELDVDQIPAFRRISVWPVVFVMALAMIDAPINWPKDFPSDTFPTEIIQKHADLISTGRLLTTDQWGDYIIYRFYPRQKVFIDGRSDFYGQGLVEEYVRLMQGAYDWREILALERFDVALLPLDWPLTTLLKTDPEWRVVEDDHRTLLFARSGR